MRVGAYTGGCCCRLPYARLAHLETLEATQLGTIRTQMWVFQPLITNIASKEVAHDHSLQGERERELKRLRRSEL